MDCCSRTQPRRRQTPGPRQRLRQSESHGACRLLPTGVLRYLRRTSALSPSSSPHVRRPWRTATRFPSRLLGWEPGTPGFNAAAAEQARTPRNTHRARQGRVNRERDPVAIEHGWTMLGKTACERESLVRQGSMWVLETKDSRLGKIQSALPSPNLPLFFAFSFSAASSEQGMAAYRHTNTSPQVRMAGPKDNSSPQPRQVDKTGIHPSSPRTSKHPRTRARRTPIFLYKCMRPA
jgi:hypothetical protein